MPSPNMDHVKKLSDKVLAKFVRRATTARSVLPPEMRDDFDFVVATVKNELVGRGVKWEATAE